MTNIEKKIMTVLILILLINSLLVFAINSNIGSYLLNLNPENTSDTLIVFSLMGMHAFFALFTMFLSLRGSKFFYRHFTLGFAILTPVIFLILNFKTIISYKTESQYFLHISLFAIYLCLKKKEKIQSGIYLYIKTLINPLDSPWY